jgi:hypothetical protein
VRILPLLESPILVGAICANATDTTVVAAAAAMMIDLRIFFSSKLFPKAGTMVNPVQWRDIPSVASRARAICATALTDATI